MFNKKIKEMKYRINPLASDIIISVYVVVSLYLRVKYESQPNITVTNSLVIGICFMVILWSLIKLKILNPNWFGIFNSKKTY